MESKRNNYERKREEVLKWANITRLHVDDIRNGSIKIPDGETKEYHIKRFVLGQIAGDDFQLSFDDDYFISEDTQIEKEATLIRLNYELSLKEVPEEVKHFLDLSKKCLPSWIFLTNKIILRLKMHTETQFLQSKNILTVMSLWVLIFSKLHSLTLWYNSNYANTSNQWLARL